MINNTNNKNEQSQLEYSNILPNESQLSDLTMSKTNTSFVSLKSNDTMGIDFNKFLTNNNSVNMTIHEVSQTEDLGIITAVNAQHNNLCDKLTKRFNSMKIIAKSWAESNINSTIQTLKNKRDILEINDFFTYCLLARDDVTKIPFNLEHSIDLLEYVNSLINSRLNPYKLTGYKTGMIFIKILFEKIVTAKQCLKTGGLFEQTDPALENRLEKCDIIIDCFKKIYKNINLNKLKDPSLRESAQNLCTDIEFFLRPFNNSEGRIKIINTN